MWNKFFNPRYPSYQIDICNKAIEEIYKEINFYKQTSPIIIRTRLEEGMMGKEIPDIAKKISRSFPNARIIVSPRSQKTMLASHYGQYVMNGGRLGFDKYLEEVVKSKWYYSYLIESLYKEFGKKNVFVYLFEDFTLDKRTLLCDLEKFVSGGVEKLSDELLNSLVGLPRMNPQRKDLIVDTALLLNKLRLRHRKNAVLPEIKGPGGDHLLVEMVAYILNKLYTNFGINISYNKFDDRGKIEEVYSKDNNKLSNLLGRDLRKYGYPC